MSSIVEDIVIIDDGLTPVQRYFKKLTDLVDLILYKNPSNEDFVEFERLLRLGGVSDRTIHQIYRNCNFSGWDDYLYKRKGTHTPEERIYVDCVSDKIRGALAGLRITFSKELRNC